MEHKTAFAKGRNWWISVEKPQGGYVIIKENAIKAVWSALQRDEIDLRSLRVWLACHEAVARRKAARSKRTPRYSIEEIHSLIGGVGGEHVRRSLRRLEKVGFVNFTTERIELITSDLGGRPIPVPRRLLRHLAQPHGRGYLATALGQLMRCLYLRSGRCISGGYCKASWVAETFDVALRAVKSARADLISRGYIASLACDQLRLNRLGMPTVVVMSNLSTTESARRPQVSTAKSAPLREHKNLSLRRSDHHQSLAESSRIGADTKGSTRADLKRVTNEDLSSPVRLVSLFEQAERKGWVQRCDADKLNFLAAAERAKRVASVNAPGLFVKLVSRQLFDFVAIEDEERARGMLRDLRERGAVIARRLSASRTKPSMPFAEPSFPPDCRKNEAAIRRVKEKMCRQAPGRDARAAFCP